MGKKFSLSPKALEYFDRANEALNFDLKKICFEGPSEKLKLTEYTQPAILTHSMAMFHDLCEKLHQ